MLLQLNNANSATFLNGDKNAFEIFNEWSDNLFLLDIK